MSNDIVFVDGMRVFSADKAPEFVWADIVVNTEQFAAWMYEHVDQSGQVRIQLREGRSGNLYLALNTWKPRNQEQGAQGPPARNNSGPRRAPDAMPPPPRRSASPPVQAPAPQIENEGDGIDDIPF